MHVINAGQFSDTSLIRTYFTEICLSSRTLDELGQIFLLKPAPLASKLHSWSQRRPAGFRAFPGDIYTANTGRRGGGGDDNRQPRSKAIPRQPIRSGLEVQKTLQKPSPSPDRHRTKSAELSIEPGQHLQSTARSPAANA